MMNPVSKFKTVPLVIVPALFALMLMTGSVFAQYQEQIAIPLSNPGDPGQFNLTVIRGSLNVSGYDGNEVIIRFEGEEERTGEGEETRNGLRRISGHSPGFEATENNNVVTIRNVSLMKNMDFDILVPRNFSLKLSLVHGGGITVENVDGDLEITHVNGEVNLTDVTGSAVINTVNGDIKASFRNVTQGKPMAFSNVNGDIDVTLPASTQLTAKMRTEWGDIYTDFDMEIQRGENVRVDSDARGYKVAVNNWVLGDINGGGPEYLFKTLHGDIMIRKR